MAHSVFRRETTLKSTVFGPHVLGSQIWLTAETVTSLLSFIKHWYQVLLAATCKFCRWKTRSSSEDEIANFFTTTSYTYYKVQ